MINAIYTWPNLIAAHRSAPLLEEREAYLAYLIKCGSDLKRLRTTANFLLHIVRCLDLHEMQKVPLEQIVSASHQWATKQEVQYRTRKPGRTTPHTFRQIATGWFAYHNALILPPKARHPFADMLATYIEENLALQRILPRTLRSYATRSSYFLRWLADRVEDFSSVNMDLVAGFLEEKMLAGWKPRTLASQCQALRHFFAFASESGWCMPGIERGIKSPRIPKYDSAPKCPPWQSVQRMIRGPFEDKASEYRSRMVCLLLTIYGLRATEVTTLMLNDFDWINETMTVHRCKGKTVQTFPLSYEVGNAVIAYLRYGRPKCECRNLLVTRFLPHRPVHAPSLWTIVARSYQNANHGAAVIGPHALRRSCATQLLKRGVSLTEIASFLGHSNTKSVGIYARYDPRTLRMVSQFGMRGIL